MATAYPDGLDDFTNPTSTDPLNSSTVRHSLQHANVNDAVEAIEGELGTNPKGSSASVKARLDTLDSTVAGKVATTRSISTTSPLSGGGALSSDLTLSVSAGSTSTAGVLQLTDSTSSTSITTAATPNAVKTTYDLTTRQIPVFPYVAGRYYKSQNSMFNLSTTSGTIAANITYWQPFYVYADNTFDRIGIASGSTFSGTATVRLGIYNDTNNLPSTVKVDAGTISATAASTTYLLTISTTLTKGWYWLAVNCQTAATTNSYYGVAGIGAYTAFNIGIASITSNSYTGYAENTTVTSGFATAGTPGVSSGVSPTIGVRSA